MKKEYIMISLILILVVVGHVLTQNYSKKVFKELNDNLVEIRGKIVNENKNSEEMISNMEKLNKNWQKESNVLAYYTEHDELEKIGNKLAVINAATESEEYGEAIMQIDECIFIIEHLNDKEVFRLVNIF